jgi:acetyltransferase-like isoleucine patch superfamily enzyme
MANQAYTIGLRQVGQDVAIWPTARIIEPEVITVGDAVIIDDFVFLMGGSVTTIGSFVHIASFSSITGGGAFTMESFSGLSAGVRIYTGNEDYGGSCLTNPTVPPPYRVPVRTFVHIKKHAIVGANSVVLPGVVIGEGVAVGANSLVTRDCAAWTIYAGTPARALRPRPREKIIELEAALLAASYDGHGRYLRQRHSHHAQAPHMREKP